MSNDIEARLKKAYLANGGTEGGFETTKGNLIEQYRNQATITAALEEARKPPTMNELMRQELKSAGSRNDGFLRRLGARNTNQEGHDDVA
jgi:hypothetical protein